MLFRSLPFLLYCPPHNSPSHHFCKLSLYPATIPSSNSTNTILSGNSPTHRSYKRHPLLQLSLSSSLQTFPSPDCYSIVHNTFSPLSLLSPLTNTLSDKTFSFLIPQTLPLPCHNSLFQSDKRHPLPRLPFSSSLQTPLRLATTISSHPCKLFPPRLLFHRSQHVLSPLPMITPFPLAPLPYKHPLFPRHNKRSSLPDKAFFHTTKKGVLSDSFLIPFL